MKEQKNLFITNTIYNNLGPECLVMVKSFYDTYSWVLSEKITNANVVINVTPDRVFIGLLNSEKKEFLITELDFDLRKLVKRKLYLELQAITQKSLPWGLLQGIRPTKLVFKIYNKLLAIDYSKENHDITIAIRIELFAERIKEILVKKYLVSEKMADLAINVAVHEEMYIPTNLEDAINSFSIYISIPFCPTRCDYCSFPSHSMNKWATHMEDYIIALKKEWYNIIPELLKNKKISTVYIGGGTPTSFSASELKELLTMIHETLPMNEVKELTVEAGRPDTITKEKLKVLKEFKVDRISINPQTMHQKTLDIIGRKHSVKQLVDSYYLAKSMGFNRINMDIIIGLPNESKKDIDETIKEILEMDPSEVTVHTLAIKRSSKIHENIDSYKLPNDSETKEMLEVTREALMNQGEYEPYYLYRQKNMVGSYENVGYFKSEKPCIYNIEIMEEVRPIIAFGAGGITKMLTKDGKLKRSENVKNVKDYISRVDTMIERKRKILNN